MSLLSSRLAEGRTIESDNRAFSLKHLGATLLYTGLAVGLGKIVGDGISNTDVFNGFACAVNCISNCDIRPYTSHILSGAAAIYTVFKREDATYSFLSRE